MSSPPDLKASHSLKADVVVTEEVDLGMSSSYQQLSNANKH